MIVTDVFISTFLSTPSARRATRQRTPNEGQKRISIHALREEGDLDDLNDMMSLCEFLSTPSARRATLLLSPASPLSLFLSTPSARRATAKTEKNISAFVSL